MIDQAVLVAEPAFQFPESGGFGDPGGACPGHADDGIAFPAKGQIEGVAGGSFLRRCPLPLAHRSCCRVVCAGHAPVLPGGILAPSGYKTRIAIEQLLVILERDPKLFEFHSTPAHCVSSPKP